jgi:peptidoglycan hydrolase CwlO-like protein
VHVTLGGIVSVGSLLGLLIVVTGILGAAFRTSRNVSTINNYRDAAQSWEARANAQEQELAGQQTQIDACNAQIEGLHREVGDKDKQIDMLQAQITSLRELLSGRAAFESLSEKISEALQLAAEQRRDMKLLIEIERARGESP